VAAKATLKKPIRIMTLSNPATAASPPTVRTFCCALLLFCLFSGSGIVAVAAAADPIEVVVEGIDGDARKNVLESLALPPGLVQNGKADRLWLERFARQAERKVPAALEPFGYYSAKTVIQIETPEADKYRLRVQIDPGQPAVITGVNVTVTGSGASEATLAALASDFPLRKGAVLVHPLYEKAKQALQSRAEELGYLDAAYAVHEVRVDEAGRSAVITLALETGQKYFFSTVAIKGAPDYPDAFLRRYLTFQPGEAFSYGRMAASQLQLNNSERFRRVIVRADKEQARDGKIPAQVILTPAPHISLRPGIGYGTDTGARFALHYRDLNMLHRGHELDSRLYISQRLQGIATSYILPSDRDIRTFTSAQINLQQEEISTYDSRIISMELARTHSFASRGQGSVYVKFQREEFTIGSQDSTSRYILPGVRFSDSRFNNLIRPDRGFRYAFDLRGAHQALGSTTRLLQFIGEAGHILPLPWRLSFLASAKAGFTVFTDEFSDLPPSLRFFAGGDQSVRGYAYQSLGPRDAQGNVVGGKHLLIGGVELQRAILENWAVSVFYNAGNAFDTFSDLTLFQAAGAGIHYHTPVGALNLYIARQIRVDDPEFRIHFTVGVEF